MAKRNIWEIFGKRSKRPRELEEPPPREEIELHQALPALFNETLTNFLHEGEEPVATLFVPSSRILEWTPGRALVLTEDGALFMEEGESIILDRKWGVKTVYYPYSQIASVGMGEALLRGRFTLHANGGSPRCEMTLRWFDVYNFRAATNLIRARIARDVSGTQHADSHRVRHSRQQDAA
jgi:hypothetical protein